MQRLVRGAAIHQQPSVASLLKPSCRPLYGRACLRTARMQGNTDTMRWNSSSVSQLGGLSHRADIIILV
eukprot:5347974-Pyramimonas_sp.AAC.1